MRLKDTDFRSFVVGEYSRAVGEVLLENKDYMSDAGCPVTYKELDFYKRIQTSEVKYHFVRKVCGTRNVIAKINELLSEEEARLVNARMANDKRDVQVANCVTELHHDSVDNYYRDALKTNPFDANRRNISAKERVYIKLGIDMLSKRDSLNNRKAFLDKSIVDACNEHHPAYSVSNGTAEYLNDVITFLN